MRLPPFTHRARAFALASVLASLFPCFSSYGTILVSADAVGNLGTSVEAVTASGGSVSQTHTGSNPNSPGGNVVGRSSASFGVLRVYAESHIDQAPFGGNFAGGTASFTDEFTFNDPSRTGQPGSFTFILQVDGTLAASNRTGQTSGTTFNFGISTARLSLSVRDVTISGNNINYLSVSEIQNDNGVRSFTGAAFLGQPDSVSVPFTLGTKSSVEITLTAVASTKPEFGADCISNGENTLNWGGITSVNDSSNATVTNYTLDSGSGANYIQPIPEPSAITLMVLGGFALFAWKSKTSRLKAALGV